MPSAGSWSRVLFETIENMMGNGFTIILAHIDRYIKRYEADIDRLLEMGALAQINADGFNSFFAKRKLIKYVESGAVCAFGSDLHGSEEKSYKCFSDLRKNVGEENFEFVMRRAEEILADATIINK
jgi:tyrosine-protein phosphatase YwqE